MYSKRDEDGMYCCKHDAKINDAESACNKYIFNYVKESTTEKKSVKGWLIFFLITMFLNCIIDIITPFTNGLFFISYLVLYFLVGTFVWTIYVLCSTILLKPNSVFIAKLYLIIT